MERFVPFTAFLRVTPIRGKHEETVYDAAKLAQNVERQLENLCGGTESVVFDFAKPVAYAPQFGNKTARLTVTGNTCLSNFTHLPVGQQNVDSSNEAQTGYGATNAVNRVPSSELLALATSFKQAIETATSLVVYRLELAGFIFGETGFTFPS